MNKDHSCETKPKFEKNVKILPRKPFDWFHILLALYILVLWDCYFTEKPKSGMLIYIPCKRICYYLPYRPELIRIYSLFPVEDIFMLFSIFKTCAINR